MMYKANKSANLQYTLMTFGFCESLATLQTALRSINLNLLEDYPRTLQLQLKTNVSYNLTNKDYYNNSFIANKTGPTTSVHVVLS